LKLGVLVVLIYGIGSRIARNPKTGEAVNLPAKVASHFKPGKEMRDRVNAARDRCAIWTSTVLNDYLEFPFVGQVFAIQRHTIDKKSGHETNEIAYGLTSHSPLSANAEQVLKFNRGHWGLRAITIYSTGIGMKIARCETGVE
jgi:hypothetical protein